MIRRQKPSSSSQWSQFLLLHASVGAVLGAFVAAGILVTDVFGVGTLLWESNAQLAAGALYFLSFASTFAAGSTATAIMGLADKNR